ncbi:glycosyltransferase family 2 protein [Aquabacterium sp. A7-Y]|uniref:glycosyltransferase family 2 protein n=1 Tax=Aquabacterium sp. A7-Y TaxID=1349605 RepID=UPI00223D9D3C|nr:glycosyltransferase family A protein [Aquabacterium sp. A7-Y]MCW7538928.1 glycosyltransferase family 2 protein [Aquabacterium sp. A7-Y]
MKQELLAPDTPVLTIGLPAYDAGRTIKDAIFSVLKQTWRGSFEILVVDDGSTDDTVAIVTELADTYGAIRVVRHDRNRGRPSARNTILEEARGEFLTWIDADDLWYPNKLAVQFDALLAEPGVLEGEPVICMCAFDWKWSHSKKAQHRVPNLVGDQLRGFLNGRIGAYLWTMLARTETFRSVGKFDVHLSRLQDLDFLVRFSANGGRLMLSDPHKPLCIYLKNDDDKPGRVLAASLGHIWQKHRPLFEQYGASFVRGCRKNHLLLASRHAFRNEGRVLGAWYYCRAALRVPRILFAKTSSDPKTNLAARTERLDPAPYPPLARGGSSMPTLDIVVSLAEEDHEPVKRYLSALGDGTRAAGVWYVPPRLGKLWSTKDHLAILQPREKEASEALAGRRRLYAAAALSNSDGHSSLLYLGAPVTLDLSTPTEIKESVELLVAGIERVERELRDAVKGAKCKFHLLCPDTETLLWRRYLQALQHDGASSFDEWLPRQDVEEAHVLDHSLLAPLARLAAYDTRVHLLAAGCTLSRVMAQIVSHPEAKGGAPLPVSNRQLAGPVRNQALVRGLELLKGYRSALSPAFVTKALRGFRRLPATPTPAPASATSVEWLQTHCQLKPYPLRFHPLSTMVHAGEAAVRIEAGEMIYPISSVADFERLRDDVRALAEVGAFAA